LGAANWSGTPSQLISRRPVPKDPATFGFSVPSAVRNASTVAWIEAGSGPAAENVTAAASPANGSTSAIDSNRTTAKATLFPLIVYSPLFASLGFRVKKIDGEAGAGGAIPLHDKAVLPRVTARLHAQLTSRTRQTVHTDRRVLI